MSALALALMQSAAIVIQSCLNFIEWLLNPILYRRNGCAGRGCPSRQHGPRCAVLPPADSVNVVVLRDCRVTGSALSWDSNKLDRRSGLVAESGDLRNPVSELCISQFICGKYDFV
jgi:hypothetical protein